MTNLKLSSKMHIMIIVSVVVIAIGIAVGLICEFMAGGYFNYGGDYNSYNTVVVSYAYVEYPDQSEVKELCDTEFDKSGVGYYACVYGETDLGGEYVFKFSKSVDEAKLSAVAESINEKIGNSDAATLSNAYYHSLETELGGKKALVYGSIALAAAVVFQFLYFLIRYRLTMALSALLADVHNLAIFVSLLTITRIPVGSSVFAFAVLTVLMTMIGCCFLHDRMRKNIKNESFVKLDVNEQSDICAGESVVNIAVSSVSLVVAAVVLFVLLSISALSVSLILAPVIYAVLGAIANVYGTAFFTPAIYSRFKRIGDNFKAEHTKKVKKA